MRRLAAFPTLLTAVALSWPALAEEDKARRPVVAVFAFDDLSSADPSEVARYSAHLQGLIATWGDVDLVAPAKVSEARAATSTCNELCKMAIGRKLAADKIVHAQLVASKESCVVQLYLYDVQREALEHTSVTNLDRARCSADPLLAVSDAAAKLHAKVSPGIVKRTKL